MEIELEFMSQEKTSIGGRETVFDCYEARSRCQYTSALVGSKRQDLHDHEPVRAFSFDPGRIRGTRFHWLEGPSSFETNIRI